MEKRDFLTRIPAPACLVLMAIPVVYFYFQLFRYGVNMPYTDDFDVGLRFMLEYLDAQGFGEKLSLVFTPHNEHNIAFVKSAVLLSYLIKGTVDFKLLMVIGNAALLAILLVFVWSSRPEGGRLLYMTPVAFMVFQNNYYQLIYWGTASLQIYFSILLAFLSIILLNRPSMAMLFPAAVLAALASFTSGNGLLVFPIGLAMLASAKKYREMGMFAACMCLVFSAYMLLYVDPPHHPSPFDALLGHPVRTALFVISFIGSTFSYLGGWASVAFGAMAFAALVFLIFKGYLRKNPVIFFFMVFLVLTSVLVALSRSGFGVDYATTSRYRIISTLLFALLYIAALETVRPSMKGRYLLVALLVSVVFNVTAFRANDNYIKLQREGMIVSAHAWRNRILDLSYPDQSVAADILDRAISKGVFRTPDVGYHEVSL